MPRVTELPTPSYPYGLLLGNETFPVVQEGQTVQGKVYNVRYGLLGHGLSNIYDFELLSYELDGYVTIANLKFFQSGVEIPASAVTSIEFTGTPPLQITNGTLNDVLDSDLTTFIRFQFDTDQWDTRIRVTFNSSQYRIDEIRLAAPTAASAINLEEMPAYASVYAAGSGSNPQYTFNTFSNPSSDWDDPWSYELERVATSPLLLSNPYVPQLQFYAVDTRPEDALYENVLNATNVIFRIPNVVVDSQNMTSNILTAQDNGTPVDLGVAQVDVEIMSHRDNTADVLTSINAQLDQNYYFIGSKYTANTLIVLNNTNADHTLTVVPSSVFTNAKVSPIKAKKTIINTSATYNLTLDVSQFSTVIGASAAVVPPLSVAHFVEYQTDSIAIWQ